MSALLEISPVTATLSNLTASTLVFIDSAVEDPQFLANGIIPEAKAFILDQNRDGIKQITEILRDYPEVESIHLVSHGYPGSIQLGNTYLSLDTLTEYQSELQTWSEKSLLIYGCNVAVGDAGEELINKLHQLTEANIAASKTKTGNAALGGDWNLQARVTNTSTKFDLAFNLKTTKDYRGILDPTNLRDSAYRIAGGNYISDATAQVIAADLTFPDFSPEATFPGVKVFISFNFNPNEDSLGIQGQEGNSGTVDGIDWSYDDITGILDLRGTATLDTYQEVLRQVTYQNSNTEPAYSERSFVFHLLLPDSYVKDERFYEFVSTPLTWNGARYGAVSRDGYLLTINSAAEYNFVVERALGPEIRNNKVWIGANDLANEGDWKWVTGISVNFGRHWLFGGNQSDKDAVLLDYPKWKVEKANDLTAGYIVEYDITSRKTVILDLIDANNPPVVAAIEREVTEDGESPYVLNLLSTATDANGDDLSVADDPTTVVSSNGDRNVNFTIEDGQFSLDLNQFNNLAASESETITVNYEVTDGTEAVVNTATLVVEGMNDVPEVSAIEGEATNEDAANPYTIDLLSTATDVDTNDELSVSESATATSSNGDRTVLFNIDQTTGEFSLDLNQFNDLAASESETITVTYEVSDGQEAISNTATLVVEGRNDVPVVITEIEDQGANDNDAFELDISNNFNDVDANDTLSFSADGLPDGLVIDAAGMITGTATEGGVFEVTITAEDLAQASVRDTFELTVQRIITGTAEGDRLVANPQPNQINGKEGNDNISGFAGDDSLMGGEGDDYLKGGTENDLLEGGAGRDRPLGGKGLDTLAGGVGNDLLKGGTQDDVLMGDEGLDRLYGGTGSDTFILQSDMGLDMIHDYKVGEDILQLEAGFTGSLSLTESGQNTTINIVDGEREIAIALLKGVTDVTLVSLGLS